MQIHSGATRGSFGLEEVGKMSQDEETAYMSVSNNISGQRDLAKPRDHGALSQGLSKLCVSSGQGEMGQNFRVFPGRSAWSQGPHSGKNLWVLYTYCTETCFRLICFYRPCYSGKVSTSQLQKIMHSTCPTFVEFGIKT